MNNQGIDYKELIAFCQLMSLSLRSGKPLPESLMTMSGQRKDTKSSQWCSDLSRKLSEGLSIDEAVRALKGFDPVLARLMPLMGEKKLITLMETYTAFLISLETVREKLKAAFIYPVLLIGIILMNILHLNFILFPKMQEVIALTGATAPLPLNLLYFANYLYWPFSIVLPCITLAIFIVMVKSMFEERLDSGNFVLRIFGLAHTISLQERSRILRIINLYVQAGYSLEKSVETASELAGGKNSEELTNVAQSLARGNEPEFAFSLSSVTRVLGYSANAPTLLSQKLDYVADSYRRQSFAQLRQIRNVAFTAALLLAGMFVLMVTSGVFDSYYWLMRSLI